jgi:dTDP-4-dehydrorhamnose 3,5-epimerase
MQSADDRGWLRKHCSGETAFVEVFTTLSNAHVLRGFHFQGPPHAQAKLVSVLQGEVIDVVLDIRRSSPTFGRYEMMSLNSEWNDGIFLLPGIAHAFYVAKGPATLLYAVSDTHAPDCDMGIRWDSVGVPWGVVGPRISIRDQGLPEWGHFQSPFP